MLNKSFRLTIRNVNRKNYTLSVETIASFRLTIRNVNSDTIKGLKIPFPSFRLTIRNVNLAYLICSANTVTVLD